ncbi:MAG: DoxX family protein [Actinomycetota bacterium]|nr:DoxX family protein [Actinomycetota bacterium]
MTSALITPTITSVRIAPTGALPLETHIVRTSTARIGLSVLRLATGFIFLWAFLDKTFGLGYSTPAARAWIHGGTPSQGFLTGAAVSGPLKPFFAAIASPASDVLFMIGMLAIGVAVMLGVGLRVSAVVGTVILVLMYLAEWSFGANAASTNPLVDYHIIYALALIVVALVSAGDTWGFGLAWKRLPLVQRMPWLI